MKHLSEAQIQSLVDRTIPPGERDRLLHHTESCPQCLRRLEFQTTLVAAIRKTPLHKTSRGFTAGVMGRVAPELRPALLFRLFGGAGRILAMAAVLAVIAYALTLNVPGTSVETVGTASEMFKEVASYYGIMKEFISTRSSTMNKSVETNASNEGVQVLAMTLLVLVILALIDRFALRHFVKPKQHRQTVHS